MLPLPYNSIILCMYGLSFFLWLCWEDDWERKGLWGFTTNLRFMCLSAPYISTIRKASRGLVVHECIMVIFWVQSFDHVVCGIKGSLRLSFLSVFQAMYCACICILNVCRRYLEALMLTFGFLCTRCNTALAIVQANVYPLTFQKFGLAFTWHG